MKKYLSLSGYGNYLRGIYRKIVCRIGVWFFRLGGIEITGYEEDKRER